MRRRWRRLPSFAGWRASFQRWSRRMRLPGRSRTAVVRATTFSVARGGAIRTWLRCWRRVGEPGDDSSERWRGEGSKRVTRQSNSGEALSSHPLAPNAGAVAGVERIEAAFRAAKEEGRAALMPYMMAGYPDRESSLAVAESYADNGADLVELGVPFSDPLADGPTIHAAATAALGAGATLGTALEVCRSVSDRVPVVLMVYVNMVL